MMYVSYDPPNPAWGSFDVSGILETSKRQLLNEPTSETRNRKPMRPNPVAPWELRIGQLEGVL